ncbi:MAG: hydantoinase B/oxoprolinase family protein, partial [Planctomycetales bacterium]|nr:hydantoinase B/oxoprolinase family protein [Planctomycetales bacterium]
MHGYLNPQHELELQRLAREVGFTQISCSSQLAPLVELVARGQTTVVDAYLSPVIRGYLQRLVDEFGGPGAVQLQVMTSAGGLVEWKHYSGKDSILSGPAGGVAALRGIAVAIGRPALIGLDMGGTSTDVSRVSEEHNLQYESTKAGVRILTPTLPIETVASGGGSICWFDGVSLRVGPQSAGASPGPACYGRGGPLTVTDLNVFLGRIPAAQFPFPLDETAIEVRLDEVLAVAGPVLGLSDRAALALGFRRIANAQMAEAVRTVSMAQGADPRAHALLGFGGAAGQHICEIAETLDIREIFDSQEAGLLSALGMGLAEQRRDAALAIYQPLESVDWPALEAAAEQEAAKLQELMQSEGAAPERLQHSRWLELRYAKSDAALTIPWTAATPAGRDLSVALRYSFEAAHRQRFGYARPAQALELVALRLEALSRGAHHLTLAKSVSPDNSVAPTQIVVPRSTESPASTRTRDKTDAIAEVEPSTTPSARYGPPHIQRDALLPGMKLQGPCLVLNQGSTLAIEGGWSAECLSEGTLRLWRQPSLPTDVPPSNETLQASDARQAGEEQLPTETSVTETSVTGAQHAASFDPVFRDCFAQRLSAIATQMGVVLQQTAVSVNVKQRRDYSCAVFNARGQLLANAPHVPVHLGAMGQ